MVSSELLSTLQGLSRADKFFALGDVICDNGYCYFMLSESGMRDLGTQHNHCVIYQSFLSTGSIGLLI